MKTFIEYINNCENPSNFQYANSLGYRLSKVFYNEDKTRKQYLFVKPNGDWWHTPSEDYLVEELVYKIWVK